MTATVAAPPAEPIELEVIGVPAPQGDKSAINTPAGPRLIEAKSDKARANLKAWRQGVASECRAWLAAHPQGPLDEPLRVTICFRFAMVTSDPFRTLHQVAPDVDKLTRATFDALVHGGLLRDDSRVCVLIAEKRYAVVGESVGASITIERLGGYEADRRIELKAAAAEARRRAKTAS